MPDSTAEGTTARPPPYDTENGGVPPVEQIPSASRLFMPNHTRFVLFFVFLLFVSYFFLLLALGSSMWAAGNISVQGSSTDWSMGMWTFCEDGASATACMSLDTFYSLYRLSEPSSLISSRACGVLAAIFGGVGILLWIALMVLAQFGGTPSQEQYAALKARKNKWLWYICGSHWISSLFAVITCFTMRSFLTWFGALPGGHYHYALVLWVIGAVIGQTVLPIIMRFLVA